MKVTKNKKIIASFILYILFGLLLTGIMYISGKSFLYSMAIYHISLFSALVIRFIVDKLFDWVYS